MALSSLQSQNFISILAQQFLKGERKNRIQNFLTYPKKKKNVLLKCVVENLQSDHL